MKISTLFCTLLLCTGISLSSCTKCDKNVAPTLVPVTVVRNCTGAYLRYEGREYKICNGDIAGGFSDGTTAKAAFARTENCMEPKPEIVCYMAYPYEAVIQVSHIE